MAVETLPRRITTRQIRAIWAKARVLDMTEEELRELVYHIRGKRSRRISTMSYQQAQEVLDALQNMIEILEARSDRATQRQLWKMRTLALEIFKTERRFWRWLERKFGVSHPMFLTRAQATKVITALQKIHESGYRMRPPG